MEKERDALIDIVRGFAMVCVILGHCIQEGSGIAFSEGTLYFQDRCYQFLYSFHMPLFMLISGYLSWKSISRAVSRVDRWRFICKRCAYLAIPIWGWGILDQIRIYIENQWKNYQLLPKYLFRNGIVYILTNLWFLWAILICFLLVCMMHYMMKDSLAVYVVIFILMFVTPDGLGLGVYKYMIPYYLTGFYYHKQLEISGCAAIWKRPDKKKQDILLLLGSGILFMVMFFFFDDRYFIYLTGYKLLGKEIGAQLWIDGYRFLIGMVSSIFFIMLWSLMTRNKAVCRSSRVLAYIGKRSLGMYILSGYVIIYLVRRVAADCTPDYFVNALECIAVLAISAMLYTLLERIPLLKKLIGVK